MEKEFWLKKWSNNEIGFHNEEYNPKLLKYFDILEHSKNDNILVPLCGKSRDLTFLLKKNLNVTGVEFSPSACEDYFREENFPYSKITDLKRNVKYVCSKGPLVIICGDFFSYQSDTRFDYIYDRAALIAIDPKTRIQYVEKLKKLLGPKGSILLITLSYISQKLIGPPFSVSPKEVDALFSDNFSIGLLEKEEVQVKSKKFIEMNIEKAIQRTYLLKAK